MTDRITLKPTEDDLDHWVESFVPTPELWWWDASPIPNAHLAQRVLPRGNHRDDSIAGHIRWVNSYHAWAMSESTSRIIVDDGSWITSLSDQERKSASEMQVSLRRGLCVPVHRLGCDVSIPDFAISADKVVLDRALWLSLPDFARRSIIEAELADWDRDTSYSIPGDTPVHIAEIANRFIQKDGVNCLSVTAFAITARPSDLHQWMMPDAFQKTLRAYGYRDIFGGTADSGDVVVFQDDSGNIVHAAFALKQDRFLNKNGQTSFNPISIIDLDMLTADWVKYEISIYRQS